MEYTPEQQAYLERQQALQQQQVPQPDQPISKDVDFMRNLFAFKEEVVGPLIHLWRGEEETTPGVWEFHEGQKDLAIMNQKGITWCSSFIASFINSVYVLSNYDEANMNDTMRRVTRTTWNTLAKRYEDFDLKTIDIPRVALECWSKIHAILLACRGEGLRRFLSSTHHIDEVKTTQIMPQQQSRGWGIFKKKLQPVPPTNNMQMY